MTKIDESKRKRSGGDRLARYTPLPASELRTRSVNARLNESEWQQLEERRALVKMQRGEYLRAAAFSQLPPSLPAVNRDAYLELTRIGHNLNQIAKHFNAGELPELDALRREIDVARKAITDLGAGGAGGGDES